VTAPVVDEGLLGRLAHEVPPCDELFLVTDENVRSLVPRAYASVASHVIAPGEPSKSWDGLHALLLAMDEAGLDRDGHVLAIGGGVVTDLAGFAASLHRRGVPWTAVPTSLIGQVDAAIGGKTAVNLAGGKNTIGTFHAPERVLVDPWALATLPETHVRAGLGEVLKTALVAGEALTDAVEALTVEDFTHASTRALAVLHACVETKHALVTQDPRDRDARRRLNLGHTFGHAFEAAAMPALLHGEAVGLGLLCAARMAAPLDHADPLLEGRLRAILTRWELPTRFSGDRELALRQLRRDKKRARGVLTVVLPLGPGRLLCQADPHPDQLVWALGAVEET